MQATPKKTKAATSLRNIHNEQITRLQTKHQQDVDFLEDIRNFSKLRAAIEREYGQALLKLATTYLQRKMPNISEIKSSNAEDRKIVYTVWKSLLDETEKIAKARLAAAEVYQQQVSESAKVLRANKIQLAKKCFDNIRKMQEEMHPCVQELDKTKKLYFEEEHMAHEAREKAHDAEEKLKKKKGRIFQSISSLQKTSTKFSFRKEACDIQATKARNDYILALVAANAHQSKYYTIDLPAVLQLLDCDIYEKVREYIQLISRTELLTSAACQASFTVVQDQAQLITRQYTLECFLEDNPVLAKMVQYAFDPCDNDKIDKISTEYNAGVYLTKEAKKWATCIAKEARTLCNSWKEINRLQTQLTELDKNPEAGEQAETKTEIENKIDELKQVIRRAETSKLKAEARIEALREGEVNVDEYIRTDVDSLGPFETSDSLSRTGTISSRGSRKSSQAEQAMEDTSEANDSFCESDLANGAISEDTSEIPMTAPTTIEDATATWEDMPPTIEDATAAWDEVPPLSESVDGVDYSEYALPGEDTETINSLPIRCIALFNYQATSADELSFVEQEELEIVSEDVEDGWIKARNYLGEEGLVPRNYVEIEDRQQLESSIQPAPASFSSVDYYIPESSAELSQPAPEETEEIVETALPEVEATVAASEEKKEEKELYCQALYDYQAACDDELSFTEGQLILILRKTVHDIDDGWWEGEIDGKVGLFPSLLVEEIRSEEGSVCSQDAMSPIDSAPPPAHTPPKPQFMSLPAQVILTQPTPEIEEYKEGQSTAQAVSVLYNDPDFHLEMPGNQQAQYQTQFSASDNDSEVSEQEVVAAGEEIGKYAPLVSSPESPTHAQSKGAEKEEAVEAEEPIVAIKPGKMQIPTVEISIAPDESPTDDESVDHTENTYRSAEELDFDGEIVVAVDDTVKDTVSSEEKLQDKTSATDSASSCQEKDESKIEAKKTSATGKESEVECDGSSSKIGTGSDQQDSFIDNEKLETVKTEDKPQVE